MLKQRIIIGLSVALLLAAIYMIARDLFHPAPGNNDPSCCGDDLSFLKKIDPTQVGYTKTKVIDTGIKELSGIAVDNQQQVFLCGNKQVIAYDASGLKIADFPIPFNASCLAIHNDKLYLGNGSGITVFSKDGKQLALWNPVHAEGLITSMAAGNKYIYAADAISKRIFQYDPDGNLLLEIGKKDSLKNVPGFIIPSLHFDIALGAFEELWAVNPGRQHLENYSVSGQLESEWGKPGNSNAEFMGCCNPAHIAVLPNSFFVTYEKGIDKIKVFDPAGKFLCLVAGAGSFKGDTDFKLGDNNLVKDMASGTDGKIYVLDAYNRVNVFRKREN